MKKGLLVTLMLAFTLILFGCNVDKIEDGDKEVAERLPISIIDANDVTITITQEIDGIIPLASSGARAISILGKENLILGTPERLGLETTFFPRFLDLPSVGNRRSPDVEKITSIALNYDNVIVLARGGQSAIALQESLSGTNVTVVSLNFGVASILFPTLEKLATLLDAEERAAEYIEFVRSYLTPITKFTQSIAAQDRVSVFFGKLERPLGAENPEDITGWLAIGPQGSSYELIGMAGGRPITHEMGRFSDVTLEWIMAENPQKAVLWALFNAGYVGENYSEFERMHGLFSGATGLSQVDAVKNFGITVVAVEIAASPHFIVTIIALVEEWYPDQFDFCAEKVHQEIIDRFHSVEFDVSTQGAFIYTKRD